MELYAIIIFVTMRTTYVATAAIAVVLIIGGVGITATVYQNQQEKVAVSKQKTESQKNENTIDQSISDDVDEDAKTETLDVIKDEGNTFDKQKLEEKDEDTTAKEEPKEIPQSQPARRNYTNPYFPGFNVAYDDTWTFNTSTNSLADVGLDNLVTRETTLSKGNTTIKIFTFPAFITGCGGEDRKVTQFTSNLNNSGLARYDTRDGKGDFYASANTLQTEYCYLSRYLRIKTNIKGENLTNPNDPNVEYWAYVLVEGAEYLNEADQIIGNSTLQTLK